MFNPAMLEEARRKGIDVSWAEGMRPTPGQWSPAPGGTQVAFPATRDVPMPGIMPETQAMLQAITAQQQASPLHIPFAPGTPTQRRREADIGAEQWGRQFDWGRDVWEQEFERAQRWREEDIAYQQERDRIADQLARARAATPAAGAAVPGLRTATLTERDRIPLSEAGRQLIRDIQENPHMTLTQFRTNAISQAPELMQEGITLDDFLDFINQQYFIHHYTQALEALYDPSKHWPYGQDLAGQKMAWFHDMYGPGVKPPATKEEKITAIDETEKYVLDEFGKQGLEHYRKTGDIPDWK